MIKESEERFKLIFNESPIGILVTTRELELININPIALKMIGVADRTSVLGKSFSNWLPAQYKNALFNGETVQFELDIDFEEVFNKQSIVSENKGIVNFEITGHFIIIQKEQYELFYLQNITPRKELEQKMKLSQKKAEESDKLKSAFLANMSHEIRTPLNSILGFSSLLSRDGLEQDVKSKYQDIVNKNGEQLLKIINEIIDISKIEAGVVQVCENSISLIDFFSDLQHTFNLPKFRKENVVVNIHENKEICTEIISTDLSRLKQIFLNLTENALKFTQEGVIEIGYSLINKQNRAELLFYVKDTGIGIPGDKQELIFERFRQAEDSLTRTYGGNGLGLSLSKSYIELLGGRIWVESNIGNGSVFYFTIPFRSGKTIETPKAMKEETSYTFEGKSIMVVEDNESSYYFLAELLSDTKANLIYAENGKAAVQIVCGDQAIDLILMDIQMPELNGIDATQIIKKIRPHVPIIAQTANAMIESQKNYTSIGFDDYITKPIRLDEMLEKIAKCLSS